MSLSEEIQQQVEAAASPDVVKNALIEERTKTLINDRKSLLSWAMSRLDSLNKNFAAIIPDHKTFDADGNVTATYNEATYKNRVKVQEDISKLQDAIAAYNWDDLKKIRNEVSYQSYPLLGSGCLNYAGGDLWASSVMSDYYKKYLTFDSISIK